MRKTGSICLRYGPSHFPRADYRENLIQKKMAIVIFRLQTFPHAIGGAEKIKTPRGGLGPIALFGQRYGGRSYWHRPAAPDHSKIKIIASARTSFKTRVMTQP